MTDTDWKDFFTYCYEILGTGDRTAFVSESWCSWTTFGRLTEDAGYWTSGLPSLAYIGDSYIEDSSCWSQPFLYKDIAHIIIPKEFYWEKISKDGYENGRKKQKIVKLSKLLTKNNLKHNMSSYALDIKLF